MNYVIVDRNESVLGQETRNQIQNVSEESVTYWGTPYRNSISTFNERVTIILS